MKRRDFLATSASAGIALAAVSLPGLPIGLPNLGTGLVPNGDRKSHEGNRLKRSSESAKGPVAG